MSPFHQDSSSGNRTGALLRVAGVCVLAFTAVLAAAVSFWDQTRDDSLAKIQRRGVIRVGYAVEEPYAFVTENGKVSGAYPEMAVQIARELGISRIEWRLTDFNSLIDNLNTRQFDVIAAGMFITTERLRRAAFSSPAFKARSGLLVEKGNPHRLHSYSGIRDDSSIRVAVLSGSVEEAEMVHLGVPDARLIRTPAALAGQLLIASNRADALALSLPTLEWMLRKRDVQNAEIAVHYETGISKGDLAAQYSAFVFRKADNALRKAWNGTMREYIGSRKHLAAVEPFGFSEADIPPGSRVLSSQRVD